MSDIPADIMQVSRDIVTDMCVKRGQMVAFHMVENEYLERAISDAVLSERARCAAIADRYGKFEIDSEHGEGYATAASNIASAIRKSPEPVTPPKQEGAE